MEEHLQQKPHQVPIPRFKLKITAVSMGMLQRTSVTIKTGRLIITQQIQRTMLSEIASTKMILLTMRLM